MPLVDQDKFIASQTPGEIEFQDSIPTEDSGFLETVEAAFGQDNTVVNITSSSAIPRMGYDSKYNPFDNDFEKIRGYEDHLEAFIGADSDEEIDSVKLRIDRELEAKSIIENASNWYSIPAVLSANIVDPLILIPGASIASVGTKAAKIGKGAATGTAFGTASGISRETILQTFQETRPIDESVINVITEGALGGILGGVVASVAKSSRASATVELQESLKGREVNINISDTGKINTTITKDASSAQTKNPLEDEGLAQINQRVAKILSGPKALQPVALRGVTNPYSTVREITNKLFSHNYILGKETKGISRGNIAEQLKRQDGAEVDQITFSTKRIYKNYIKASKSEGITPINRSEFDFRVSRVLRDSKNIDELSEVNQVAATYRGLLTKYARQLKDAGLMSEDITEEFALNYLTRIYDKNKLVDVGVRERFVDKISKYYSRYDKEGNVRVAPLDIDEAQDLALDTYKNILGQGDFHLEMDDFITGKGISKPSKSRLLQIPDSELEEFLVNDATLLVNLYARRSSALVRTQNALKELGHDSIADAKKSLETEHEDIMSNLTNKEARRKQQNEFNDAVQFLDEMHNLSLGRLMKPGEYSRFLDFLLKFNTMRLLGGVTISSLAEAGMTPFRAGLTSTLKDAYLPMIRSFQTAKLSKDQWKDLQIGNEAEINTVLHALADSNLELGVNQTRFEKYTSELLENFGKATGISYWTAGGRRIAAQASASNIVRQLNKSKSKGLTDKEVTFLANAGISKSDYGKLLDQINKHSETIKGSWFANFDQWDDVEAVAIFKRAVQNETESIILKPGAGERPIFAQKNSLGRLLFQFKSFMSAATGRITISSLQRKDAKVALGLTYLVTLGALTEIIHNKIADRESPEDIDELITAGFSRSGILGLVGTTLLDTSISLTDPDQRLYSDSRAAGMIFGPSVGLIMDSNRTLQKWTDGKLNSKDLSTPARLMPFQNLFYIRYLSRKAFEDNKEDN